MGFYVRTINIKGLEYFRLLFLDVKLYTYYLVPEI